MLDTSLCLHFIYIQQTRHYIYAEEQLLANWRQEAGSTYEYIKQFVRENIMKQESSICDNNPYNYVTARLELF